MAKAAQSRPEPPPAIVRESWEYDVIPIVADNLATLNAAGAAGWELIAADYQYQRYVLKRRLGGG